MGQLNWVACNHTFIGVQYGGPPWVDHTAGAQVGQVDWVACVWGSGWTSRTWWYTTLCVFAAYWTLQGDHGVGPSLVDQVAGAQVGHVYLGDLCLWLQVDLQPYLYGGAAWWASPHGWALLRGTGGPG